MATIIGIHQVTGEDYYVVVYDDGREVHVAKEPAERGRGRIDWAAVTARAAPVRAEVDAGRSSGLIGQAQRQAPGRAAPR